MPKLIDIDGKPIPNDWLLLDKDSDASSALAQESAKLLVPLQLWLSSKSDLLGSGKTIAVWLDAGENVAALADDLAELPMLALNFPAFMDGRSYSSATNLRQHYKYSGEVRAIGDVLRDQLFYMRRCGFTTFDLKDSVKLDDASAAMHDYRDNYQSTIEQPQPLFRRRQDA